jgi:hypothetical protein
LTTRDPQPEILADLAVAITPKSYVRGTPMAHASTHSADEEGLTNAKGK